MAPETYNADQIQAYYARIKLPTEYRKITTISSLGPEEALSHLKIVQKYTLVALHFENLSLHYGSTGISLDPDDLYAKIVKSGFRGGYCMELNYIFATVLRSLGYTVYTAGARVRDKPDPYFHGWGHMIIIVTIGNDQYVADVGFGGNGQIHPLILDKSGTVTAGILPASKRILWRNINQNTDPNQRMWVFEHRNDDDSEWEETYCFTDLEFLPADYEVMNYFTSTSPKVFFTQKVVCERKIFGREMGLEEEADEIVGMYVILGPLLKRRIHGKNEILAEFKSEVERQKALEEYFGISLTTKEKQAINGRVSAIQESIEM